MIVTRPEQVRAAGRRHRSRIWDRIAQDVPQSLQKRVRRAIDQEVEAFGERAIDIYTQVSDGDGYLVLYRTTNRDQKNMFRVIASTCPDQRLSRSDREIPLDSVVKIAEFRVSRCRTAQRWAMTALEQAGAKNVHAEWFSLEGGGKKAQPICERVARRVTRTYGPAAVEETEDA